MSVYLLALQSSKWLINLSVQIKLTRKGSGGTRFLPLAHPPAPAVMLRPRPVWELVPDAQVPMEMASDWGMPPALRAHEGPRTHSA